MAHRPAGAHAEVGDAERQGEERRRGDPVLDQRRGEEDHSAQRQRHGAERPADPQPVAPHQVVGQLPPAQLAIAPANSTIPAM